MVLIYLLSDFTPEPFPDLTGVRSHAKQSAEEFTITSSPTHHIANIKSRTTYTDLLERSKNLQTSPLSIVQAAWASLLLCYSSDQGEGKDILFGSVIGGRTSEALESVVAPVFSSVPVRFCSSSSSGKIDATASLSKVLEDLTRSNATSLTHRCPPNSALAKGGRGGGIMYDTTIALQTFAQGHSQTDLWTHAEYPPMSTEVRHITFLVCKYIDVNVPTVRSHHGDMAGTRQQYTPPINLLSPSSYNIFIIGSSSTV